MQNNNLFVKGIRYCKVNGPIKTFKVMINKFIIFTRRKINKKNNINSEDFNKEVIKPRNTKSIHILALVPFYDIGGGQRSAQLAKTFNKLGYITNYIFPYDSTDVTKSTMEIPCRIHSHIKDIKIEEFEKYVNNEDIFIFEGPVKEFIPYIELAKKYNCKTIYENIDNWETDIGKRFFDKIIVKEFLEKCDILIATSMPLKEQLEDYQKEFNISKKEVYYLANAVDDDLFNPRLKYEKPKDLRDRNKNFNILWLFMG